MQTITTLLSIAPLLALAGCSSTSASERATAASESMQEFNVNTVKVKDGIDATLESLNALVASSGDQVKPSFSAFKKKLAALEEQSQVVRDEAAAMKTSGDEYFEEWEAGSSSMSETRHAELTKAYATIKEDMVQAKSGFEPFLASLKDVEAYLSLDLTAQGLEGVAPLAKTATVSGAEVKGRIEAVLRGVNSVRGMLSTAPEN